MAPSAYRELIERDLARAAAGRAAGAAAAAAPASARPACATAARERARRPVLQAAAVRGRRCRRDASAAMLRPQRCSRARTRPLMIAPRCVVAVLLAAAPCRARRCPTRARCRACRCRPRTCPTAPCRCASCATRSRTTCRASPVELHGAGERARARREPTAARVFSALPAGDAGACGRRPWTAQRLESQPFEVPAQGGVRTILVAERRAGGAGGGRRSAAQPRCRRAAGPVPAGSARVIDWRQLADRRRVRRRRAAGVLPARDREPRQRAGDAGLRARVRHADRRRGHDRPRGLDAAAPTRRAPRVTRDRPVSAGRRRRSRSRFGSTRSAATSTFEHDVPAADRRGGRRRAEARRDDGHARRRSSARRRRRSSGGRS